jgi:hypothetical protein
MVTITQVAEQKIRELMAEEKDVVGLRVYVRGGGCHGYQYGMAFESKTPRTIRSLRWATSKSSWTRRAPRCCKARRSITWTACRDPGFLSRIPKPRRPAAAAAHLVPKWSIRMSGGAPPRDFYYEARVAH